MDKPFIFSTTAIHSGAGQWLRNEQHLDVLVRNGLADAVLLGPGDDEELVHRAALRADTFYSNGTCPLGYKEFFDFWRSWGKPWVWDVDDDPCNISPYNPAYKSYGEHEVKFGKPFMGKHWFWKNGVAGFDAERNKQRNQQFEDILRDCSALTTTTPYLAAKLREIVGEAVPIFLRPNVLDFSEIWTHRNRRTPSKDGLVRIMYQGGCSHYADLSYIIPVLKEIAEMYDNVRFLFYGDVRYMAEKELPKEKIEQFDWTGDYRQFALLMAILHPDIAIAPLWMEETAHAEFNRCKSPLKWLDAAAVGVPCVCQNDTPFKEAVRFGPLVQDEDWNGILAGTHDEWLHALRLLLDNEDARRTIGKNAYNEARENYDADKHAGMYLKQYQEVTSGNYHAVIAEE